MGIRSEINLKIHGLQWSWWSIGGQELEATVNTKKKTPQTTKTIVKIKKNNYLSKQSLGGFS